MKPLFTIVYFHTFPYNFNMFQALYLAIFAEYLVTGPMSMSSRIPGE